MAKSLKRLATGMLMAAMASLPTTSFADGHADLTLTSEAARRLPRAQLEQLVNGIVGRQLTLIKVEHSGFQFQATMRMRPRAEGAVCSASQLTMWFVPEPNLAPPGTAPGAMHVSRLPMEARRTVATQVYRPGPAALASWRGVIETDPCEKVDPRKSFFVAENSHAAEKSLTVFEQVVRLAREDPASLNLDCGGGRTDCLKELAALQPDIIEAAADRCRGTYVAVAEQARCFSIHLRTERVNNYSRSYRTLQIIVSKERPDQKVEIEKVRFISGHLTA